MIDIEAAFGVKVVESHVADEIGEDVDSALLTARESARMILETYDEEPETVVETTDGFAVSGDRHAILFHPDGVVVHDPALGTFDPDDEIEETTFKKGQKITYLSQRGKKLNGEVVSDVGGKYKVKVMPDKPNVGASREEILVPRDNITLREDSNLDEEKENRVEFYYDTSGKALKDIAFFGRSVASVEKLIKGIDSLRGATVTKRGEYVRVTGDIDNGAYAALRKKLPTGTMLPQHRSGGLDEAKGDVPKILKALDKKGGVYAEWADAYRKDSERSNAPGDMDFWAWINRGAYHGRNPEIKKEARMVAKFAAKAVGDEWKGVDESEQVLDIDGIDTFLAKLSVKGRLPRAEVRAYENAKLTRDEDSIIETATAIAAAMDEQNAFDDHMRKAGYKSPPMPKTPSRGSPGGKTGSAYLREETSMTPEQHTALQEALDLLGEDDLDVDAVREKIEEAMLQEVVYDPVAFKQYAEGEKFLKAWLAGSGADNAREIFQKEVAGDPDAMRRYAEVYREVNAAGKLSNNAVDEAIDKGDVKDAAWKAAQKVHGEDADEEIVDEIVKKAIKQAESTEDAIQIAVNMVRGKSEDHEDDLDVLETDDEVEMAALYYEALESNPDLDLDDEDEVDAVLEVTIKKRSAAERKKAGKAALRRSRGRFKMSRGQRMKLSRAAKKRAKSSKGRALLKKIGARGAALRNSIEFPKTKLATFLAEAKKLKLDSDTPLTVDGDTVTAEIPEEHAEAVRAAVAG